MRAGKGIFNAKGLLCFVLFLLLLATTAGRAQSSFAGLEPLFTQPKSYTAYFAEKAPIIDGNINDDVWKKVSWSERFEDIEGDAKPKPSFDTRVKMVWNDTHLFIAAELKEPHVWATLKQHDEIIFHDNDFEVFLDPENTTHGYYEIEVNALNTIFDLFLPKPYRNGGSAMIPWNLDKLQSAVQVQGTLNSPKDTDQGWTVEMAIPFRSVSMGNDTKVPREGSLWRINFSRVEWDIEVKNGKYVKKKDKSGQPLPEHNWVWSPQGVVNMHYPERWGYLHFTKQKAGTREVDFKLPYAEKQKNYLWLVYYRQKEYYEKHQLYATSLGQLGFEEEERVVIENHTNQLQLEATKHQFMATIQGPDNAVWSINQEGLIQKLKNTL
ncbi:hypothetical protein FVR03_22125 [Pontibacter qinzhouensis]|uniref:Carbohydrate-binding domain-containing protein n=1 Tax=Pontibacter qinzhouensis TaxID=2603253 RepID=A0A5C8IT08_9BACT|nr:carbohydrate-binding family 9-like protein [Pontibacter qinzhouensis]TXK24933.1 hypothetical protein FVR03_22125 [Pontibacter qinzhouensis]